MIMRDLTFIILICLGCLTQWNLYGQSHLVGKTLTIPTGQVRLKTLLASISNQTGYVFSYDARKINDMKRIEIGKNNIFTLDSALSVILPTDIRYKMIEKYIVLYQKSSKVLPVYLNPTLPIVTEANIPNLKIDLSDTLNHKQLNIPLILGDTVRNESRRPLSIEATYHSHLMHLSLLLGKKTFYGKATIAYDYHESYHMGLGVGMNIPITGALGLSLDLSQYALVFGRTRKMDINTYTTELNPLVTYTLTKRFKLKVGPSFYRIQSNLSTKNSTIDLGNHLGCDAVIGLQISLL